MKWARKMQDFIEQPAKKKIVRGGKLNGEVVTFTSYRDAAHEAAVEAAGGTVASFSAKTTILLYKDGGKASTKLDTARARGICVCTFKELKV